MTNHPSRSKYRYFWVSPRGFANEITYYAVPIEQVPVLEAYFEGRKDREFDAGNTDWDWDWTTDRRARIPGVAIYWQPGDEI